eukprot:TRINITY_DN5750_c0_g1_i4.p1 TRINITY_DN5750_c0_g1~~TRINITY_DN5750_c0_g1_i4.p1  ORF type:complete len:288 (+),score=54.73 TRINITY_DN5750_c0_g1_i4:375-1238(+)
MVLSTAAPQKGGDPPSLAVSKIFFKQPKSLGRRKMDKGGMRSDKKSSKAKFKSKKEGSSLKRQNTAVGVLTSIVEKGSFNATFHIPRKCTIESDNKPHKVTIAYLDFDPEFLYTAVPSLTDRVFIKCKCINTSDYQLLPGPMNVFMDGFFVTLSSIPSTVPSAPLEVSLGVDDGVTMTFLSPDENKTGNKGLVKKSNTSETLHITTITNNKSFKITVLVYDQIPQPNDQSIKVKVLEPQIKEDNTAPITYTDEKNLQWKVEIPPGEKKILKFHYLIEWPKDKEIEFV